MLGIHSTGQSPYDPNASGKVPFQKSANLLDGSSAGLVIIKINPSKCVLQSFPLSCIFFRLFLLEFDKEKANAHVTPTPSEHLCNLEEIPGLPRMASFLEY